MSRSLASRPFRSLSPFLLGLLLGTTAVPHGARAASDLLFLSEDVPAGLDADGPSAAIPTSQTGIVNILDPLFGYAAGGVNAEGVAHPDFNKIAGLLAESWEYDPKALTWTVHLRKGVKSCAGNTLTADDVIYTFARAKSVSGAAPIGWFLGSVGSIAGFTTAVFKDKSARALGDAVTKIDDTTVRFKQSGPNSLFLPALTTFGMVIYDHTEMQKHATAADPWSHDYANNVNAVGFGAYCVERWSKNNEIVLRANPDYYRGKPAIDRIIMKKVPQSSNRVVILRSGQAQLVEHLTPREYSSLRGAPGITVAGISGNEATFLHMNFTTKPFDNIKLRQAIAYAVPYDQIIKTGYFGQAKKWNGVVPSSYPGYHEAPTQYTHDPAKAAALLAEAGYPKGAGLDKYADAFRLSYVAEKEATLGPVATVIETALKEVGIPVTLDPIPQTQYGDRQLVKKDLPFAINDQEKPIAVDAGYAMLLFFVSTEQGGLNNMVNYKSAKVDALWAKARNETDPAARLAELAEAQDQLMADVTWLPLVEYKTQWAFSSKLHGISWQPDNSVRFFDLRYAP
jgi:peptide/nickel transport system substrate-binding protein